MSRILLPESLQHVQSEEPAPVTKPFIAFALCALLVAATPARTATNNAVIDGFNKTVFGSEYASFSIKNPLSGSYVRKFPGTVKLYVRSSVGGNKRARVQNFAASLNGLIKGLRLRLVSREKDANFVVHIVKRANYTATIKKQVYKRPTAPVRGKCMVRSLFTRDGISRSDAVIVGDEGEGLFKRCMTEEILQGLGPLNDDDSLRQSIFNDQSAFTNFRRFDRLILNMLYDRRIKPGMSQREANAVLPKILRAARARVGGG